eukprot:m.142483 g.142483  ORF g.142483 m.142483 type:complete len:304 (-) comp14069_c1_seq4:828-1739(-)
MSTRSRWADDTPATGGIPVLERKWMSLDPQWPSPGCDPSKGEWYDAAIWELSNDDPPLATVHYVGYPEEENHVNIPFTQEYFIEHKDPRYEWKFYKGGAWIKKDTKKPEGPFKSTPLAANTPRGPAIDRRKSKGGSTKKVPTPKKVATPKAKAVAKASPAGKAKGSPLAQAKASPGLKATSSPPASAKSTSTPKSKTTPLAKSKAPSATKSKSPLAKATTSPAAKTGRAQKGKAAAAAATADMIGGSKDLIQLVQPVVLTGERRTDVDKSASTTAQKVSEVRDDNVVVKWKGSWGFRSRGITE